MKITNSPSSQEAVGMLPNFKTSLCLILLMCLVAVARQAHGQRYEFQRLNPPGSAYSFAFGLNNNSVVVGSFVDANSAYEGYVYEGGTYKAIVFPGSVAFTQASGINDLNTVVGEFVGSDHLTHGYLLTPAGKFTQYDVAAGASTYIYRINNAGNFVGFTSFQGQTVMGFVNIGGTVTKFTFQGDYTFAYAINSKNDTVGDFITPPPTSITHGFYRDAAGTMTQIDYPGALETVCLGINDLGEITGYYLDTNNVAHGFITKNGRFRTTSLPDIAGINNKGTLVGSYLSKNQENFGYLATPVSPRQTR